MTRILTVSALALTLAAGLTGAASAQSYTAPAGIPVETTPGGLIGSTAPDTLRSRVERADPSSPVTADGVQTTGSVRHGRRAR